MMAGTLQTNPLNGAHVAVVAPAEKISVGSVWALELPIRVETNRIAKRKLSMLICALET